MELYQRIAKYANEKLGHIWDYSPDDILRVMLAISLYCSEHGDIPEDAEQKGIFLRTLYWEEGDGAVRIMTHSI